MSLEQDDMEKRRQKRLEMQKKRQQEQRRMKLTLAAAAVVLVGVVAGIVALVKSAPSSQEAQAAFAATDATQATTESPIVKRTAAPEDTVIHIRAAGDLNITSSVVQSGLAASGYDFSNAFLDVASTLSNADITLLNLEGNICGEPYGSSTASAPREILTALKEAGVDLIQMANSYSIYNGLIGLNATLSQIRAAGLEPLGAYANINDAKEGRGYTIVNVRGVKIAFVAFTKGMGGLGMPDGSLECVNLLYEDYADKYAKVAKESITGVLKAAASEKPDITIALLHWGSENSDDLNKTQTQIANLMVQNGVDVILGTHPHRVQQLEWDEKAGTFIAYSLGDFYGNATHSGTAYSIILDLEITKNNSTGQTKVTGYDYTPIYTVKASETGTIQKVVRIHEAMEAYEGNYVDKVSSGAYDGMTYALKRIDYRVRGIYGNTDPSETTEAAS